MSHIPFTLTAYFFNAISVLIDKFLLTKQVGHPLTYVFYISVASFTSLVVIPFVPIPSWLVFTLASIFTILWTTGAFFMFTALQKGQPARVIPIIGTLIPLFLLLAGLLNRSITQSETIAVLLLTGGLISITISDWRGRMNSKELLFEILASLFFASSYFVLSQAYLYGNFLTVLGWSRIILFPMVGLALLIPWSHKIILAKDSSQQKFKFWSKNGLLFGVGQMAGGASGLLLTYSISLANPALVNSLQGSQYVFIFIGSLILSSKYPQVFEHHYSLPTLLQKILGIILIGLGLYYLAR